EDALAVARVLAAALDAPALALPAAEPEAVLLLDDLTGGEPLDPQGSDPGAPAPDGGEAPPRDPAALELASTRDEEAANGHPLSAYAVLRPEVRRQFQRIRPEMYRAIRGLEDGEDFDLNSTIDARIDVRARRAPSTRLYRSRVREARDVATLFLLDMSASTDEP